MNHPVSLDKRVLEIVYSNPPVKSGVLFAQLSSEYIDMTKDEIHACVFDLAERGAIVELNFISLGVGINGSAIYFPPETRFEFRGYKKGKNGH